jgi:solute carrier family 6 amino acid transporter-like protein 5/7/9/14
LGKSESFEDFGTPQTYGVLFVVLNHQEKFVFFSYLLSPISSLFQVAYFTAIFPYIVLLILIIQSATLSGAGEGVKYYVIPKWDLVAKFEVISQFFSHKFFLQF